MINFQLSSSSCDGIVIPATDFDLDCLIDPQEIVIPESSFCMCFDMHIIGANINPVVRYMAREINAQGYTRRQVVEMISNTISRFYNEEIKGEKDRGIRPQKISLYGIKNDRMGPFYRLVVG